MLTEKKKEEEGEEEESVDKSDSLIFFKLFSRACVCRYVQVPQKRKNISGSYRSFCFANVYKRKKERRKDMKMKRKKENRIAENSFARHVNDLFSLR